jgi:hypothetical protein
MADKERKEMVQEITAAFANIEYPEGNSIFISEAGHYFDIEEAIDDLSAKSWSDIPLKTLMDNRNRLSFLTPPAYCFFLPAYLIAAIEHPKEVDVLLDNVIESLTPPNQLAYEKRGLNYIAARQKLLARAKTLNHQQIAAVISFFKSYSLLYPPSEWSFMPNDAEKIQKAISFWEEYL